MIGNMIPIYYMCDELLHHYDGMYLSIYSFTDVLP